MSLRKKLVNGLNHLISELAQFDPMHVVASMHVH